MSIYTTQLRYICESLYGLKQSTGYTNIQDIINGAYPKIFDFDFPIYDEDYRPILCKKILKHYYTREISEETYGLWKLRFDATLNDIMPYYNKLYQVFASNFNPLSDTDYFNTHKLTKSENDKTQAKGKSKNEQNNTTTITGNTTNWDIYSDTPQGSLINVENENYLTNARKIKNTDDNKNMLEGNENTETDNTIDRVLNTTDDYVEHIAGKRGGTSYGKMIEEYKNSLINIDLEIIDNLSPLFFGLWK